MKPDSDDPLLSVAEIFHSIQGESTWAGLPCTFVRLAGCDVRCSYCDTRFAWEDFPARPVSEILAACAQWPCALVEVTGGEPLMQPDCPALVRALLEAGYTTLVETSGTRPINGLPDGAVRIMDLKCPGSGACDRNLWSNIDALTKRDEVKFVIADRRDYEWSRDVFHHHRLADRCGCVLFSAVFERLAPRQLVGWILEDNLDVRFQLQLHKYIWPEADRGV